jgi:hypothetical protein
MTGMAYEVGRRLFKPEVRFQSQVSPSGNYSGSNGHWDRFDICGSVHHSIIHKENPTRVVGCLVTGR